MKHPSLLQLLLTALVLFGLSSNKTSAQTVTWIGGAGTDWNTAANWDTGVPTAGINAVIGSNVVVVYSSPMAASSFGSLFNAGNLSVSAGGFTIDANGATPLTVPLGSNSLITVTATGVFTITNSGAPSLSATNSIAVEGGTFIVTNSTGGDFIIGASGNNGGVGFTNNAGTILFGQRVSFRGRLSRFIMNGGTLNCPAGFGIDEGSNDQERPFVINGGTANLGDFLTTRTTPGGGLHFSNGVIHTTSIRIGTGASRAYATVWGGALTNTGGFAVNDRNNGAVGTTDRRIRFLIRGGTVVSTASEGIIVANQSNTGVAGDSIIGGTLDMNAGTLIAEKITLVKDNTLMNAFGTFALAGTGIAYLGSGGIEGNPGAGNSAYFVNFSGGTLAAKANYPINANMNLAGPATIQCADAIGNPFNITANGALTNIGILIKTGAGTLTLNGTNSYSGNTLVNQGTLALGATGSFSNTPAIYVSSGATLDVSAVSGGFVHNANRTLSGMGSVAGPVNAATASIINPGSNTLTGTLTLLGSLTEAGGAVNHFDLSANPLGPDNDLLVIGGNLDVSGVNPIEVIGGGSPGSVHKLIQYGGSFNGTLANFSLTGASGSLSNDPGSKAIYLVVAATVRNPTNVTWVGNALANDWDTLNRTNWLNNGVLDYFVSGDQARFDATGAANPNVNLIGNNSPASVTVDAAANYTFSGSGGIAGSSTLTKTNSGTLIVLSTNSYTGRTTIGGGVLEAASLAPAGGPSSIGSASVDPNNIHFYGGTLRYLGATTGIDRGATFNATGAGIDLPSSATELTVSGALVGAGGLTKIGAGTLVLPNANTYSGGTVLNGGILQLQNAGSLGNGGITNQGATLRTVGALTLDNVAEFNGTCTLDLANAAGNTALRGAWSGNGTVNIINQDTGNRTFTIGGGGAGGGAMWNFSGTINFGTNIGFFRINNDNGNFNFGSSNATFDVGTETGTLNQRNGGTTTHLGALLGGPNTRLSGRGTTGASGTATYSIGGKNLSTTYEGTIIDGSSPTAITKVGTGRLTLSGVSSYTGATLVNEGVLALIDNGSIDGSAQIRVNSPAVLDVSGKLDPTLHVGSLVSQTLGGNGTIRGSVNVGASGTIAPGASIGTLTVTNSVTLNSGSTLTMELDRSGAPNSDRLVAPSIALAGTLVVANIGPALQAGDMFDLFDGAASGGFENVVLPNYYTWNTNNLAANGTITVTGLLPLPAFDSITISGNDIVATAINGAPNGPLIVITSTNVALPRVNWTPVLTNQFDGTGKFGFNEAIDPVAPQKFYSLEVR